MGLDIDPDDNPNGPGQGPVIPPEREKSQGNQGSDDSGNKKRSGGDGDYAILLF